MAIARTLATGPRILLMDEPLSNLDAKLRMEMRSELKRLHLDTDSTFVYVTHDQLEAMTLATKISLMKKGKLQQFAPPLTVYNEPANAFTADFIGNPSINLIPVKVEEKRENILVLDMGSHKVRFTSKGNADTRQGDILTLGIRPENIEITDEGGLEAKVYSTLPSGMETVVKLETAGLILTAVVFGDSDFRINDTVKIRFRSNRNHLFRKEGDQERIASGSLQSL
ncbi:ABC transporter ATP-binding protein [uncultured Dialister sp.]|uniref:ABC transporter ATP-binding protein n=1 Tax=uncultured Dialister sp. TaxID=278064 RepID=UPI0025E2A6B6|nr:ABC transporter ATP-binding protein [uncultured Dialister sp.]